MVAVSPALPVSSLLSSAYKDDGTAHVVKVLINGVEYPAVQVEFKYRLDDLPAATVSVPLGHKLNGELITITMMDTLFASSPTVTVLYRGRVVFVGMPLDMTVGTLPFPQVTWVLSHPAYKLMRTNYTYGIVRTSYAYMNSGNTLAVMGAENNAKLALDSRDKIPVSILKTASNFVTKILKDELHIPVEDLESALCYYKPADVDVVLDGQSNDACKSKMQWRLVESFSAMASQSSLKDAMSQVARGYYLNFIPRLPDAGGKAGIIDIAPVNLWDPVQSLTLDASSILSFGSFSTSRYMLDRTDMIMAADPTGNGQIQGAYFKVDKDGNVVDSAKGQVPGQSYRQVLLPGWALENFTSTTVLAAQTNKKGKDSDKEDYRSLLVKVLHAEYLTMNITNNVVSITAPIHLGLVFIGLLGKCIKIDYAHPELGGIVRYGILDSCSCSFTSQEDRTVAVVQFTLRNVRSEQDNNRLGCKNFTLYK